MGNQQQSKEENLQQESLSQQSLPQESLPQQSLPQQSLPQQSLPQQSLPQENLAKPAAADFEVGPQHFKLRGSVIVCCRNSEGKFAVVKQKKAKNLQLINGVVYRPESHLQTAIRVA